LMTCSYAGRATMCVNVRRSEWMSDSSDKQQDGSEAIDSQWVGRQVQGQLARRRMSRQALADRARISLSTLEKALAGKRPFTLATTLRLEEALAISLRATAADHAVSAGVPALANENLGA